jgi:hypothetical protein
MYGMLRCSPMSTIMSYILMRMDLVVRCHGMYGNNMAIYTMYIHIYIFVGCVSSAAAYECISIVYIFGNNRACTYVVLRMCVYVRVLK